MDGISINLKTVQTNIVMFDVSGLGLNSEEFILELNKRGIKSKTRGRTTVRMITHRGVDEEDIRYALKVIREMVAELSEHYVRHWEKSNIERRINALFGIPGIEKEPRNKKRKLNAQVGVLVNHSNPNKREILLMTSENPYHWIL